MPRYSREVKLEMIREYRENHRSLPWLREHYGISESYMRHLLSLDENGFSEHIGTGQKGKKKKYYPGSFKLEVVKDKLSSNLGYREIARKYNITHPLLMKWERIYLQDGEAGLLEERRGKTVKEGYTTKKSHNKLNKDVEQDLIAEVQRLRMENEYLKKLQALARAGEKSPLKSR